MEDIDRKMIVTDDNGKEIEMEILFTTRLEEYGKNYIFYLDPNKDDGEVFVSAYELETTRLLPIENDDEWNKLNEVLEEFVEKANEGKESCCGNCDACDKDKETCGN